MAAKKELFQIAVWYRDGKSGEDSKDKLIIEPKTVEAINAGHAERVALKLVPAEYDDKLDKIEVQVRPF